MEFFKKKIGCVFLKEDSDAESFISQMSVLSQKADGQLKKDIETQIKLANYGIYGEKNIAFELKNSDIDMYVIHDLCLEYEGLRAQIDYLIVTRQRIYILECKNLIGNIEIDKDGNFIRTYELFGRKIKEGLYSPITQNQRHMTLIKQMCSPTNIIHKHFFEKNFEDTYRSLIVLSNPKTYLNAKYAKKVVKEQVIRADSLIAYIKEIDKKEACNFTGEEMLDLAKRFLEKNISDRSDYSLKYKEILEQCNAETMNKKINIDSENNHENCNDKFCPRCGAKLVLRVAKKGERKGKEFYGCSNFPKCRYIDNKE